MCLYVYVYAHAYYIKRKTYGTLTCSVRQECTYARLDKWYNVYCDIGYLLMYNTSSANITIKRANTMYICITCIICITILRTCMYFITMKCYMFIWFYSDNWHTPTPNYFSYSLGNHASVQNEGYGWCNMACKKLLMLLSFSFIYA